MTRRFAVLVSAVLVASAANAAELRSLSVDHNRGRYSIVSEVWFDAPVDQVFAVFRQWDLSEKFSRVITEARDLPADEYGRPQYYVRNEGCLLFFCKSFERQGYVEFELNKELRAFAIPALSDFKLSNESWSFAAENGGTTVNYQLLMEPDFWVPPLIGPYIIKRKFRAGGVNAIDRIEVIAQGMPVEVRLADD